MTVPAGIYLRISRDSERLGLGVKRQRGDCEKLVKRLGWEVGGIYEDNDVSATNGKPRPAYVRMMQDVERGQRTEVSYLLGHALPIAGRLRLPVSHLTELQQRLQVRLAERGLPVD